MTLFIYIIYAVILSTVMASPKLYTQAGAKWKYTSLWRREELDT